MIAEWSQSQDNEVRNLVGDCVFGVSSLRSIRGSESSLAESTSLDIGPKEGMSDSGLECIVYKRELVDGRMFGDVVVCFRIEVPIS